MTTTTTTTTPALLLTFEDTPARLCALRDESDASVAAVLTAQRPVAYARLDVPADLAALRGLLALTWPEGDAPLQGDIRDQAPLIGIALQARAPAAAIVEALEPINAAFALAGAVRGSAYVFSLAGMWCATGIASALSLSDVDELAELDDDDDTPAC